MALLKVYGNKDLLFENAVAPAAQFIGDRADLTELLGNLLDNACKWAQSRVRIEAHDRCGRRLAHRAAPRRSTTTGRASPRPIARSVLERGGRADEATPGHGIGLAMVHDTVALYGGTMRIDSVARSAARASSSNCRATGTADMRSPHCQQMGTDPIYGPSLISNVMPWASGSSRLQLMVLVWRRM